ncbi:MAG: prolyl oligopeptidase family serine peptidase [bacterium]
MKRIYLLIMFVVAINMISAQENVYYLERLPVIDGQRADYISDDKLSKFEDIHKSDDDLPDIEAGYFLGYTAHHLYIYIEYDADTIIARDRAYQNGDGFHLTMGKPEEDGSATDEFYVLGFSPSDDWSNKIIWYYNIDLNRRRLGDNVRFGTSCRDGKAGFEVLIPWNDIPPYHPWIYKELGFNLCFVKAMKENDKIYNFIVRDRKMQSEQSRRKYTLLDFERPQTDSEFFSSPVRHNLLEEENMEIRIAGYSEPEESRDISVSIISDEEIIHHEKNLITTNAGFNDCTLALKNDGLLPGNYLLKVYDEKEVIGKHTVSVFEKVNIDEIRKSLSEEESSVSYGTYFTMLFLINELENELKELKYYESSVSISEKIRELNNYLDLAKTGIDPFVSKKGTFRRAFLSSVDQEVRPYTVYIPEDYQPGKEYPLLVYLHGSGQDDRALFTTPFIKNDFIVLAPNGRGTSNCFATEEAQKDIKESIDDVRKNYNINESRIVLSGFSMGGYGVYRTYYEYPGLFHALAIISGHPDLAVKWGMDNAKDFLDRDLVARFSDIPVFIYHGKQDINCPYELIVKFVKMLEEHNKNIVFLTDDNAGHSSMSQENKEKYFSWLRQLIEN